MFKQKRQFPKYRVVQNVLVKSGVPNLTHLIYPTELKISPNLAKPNSRIPKGIGHITLLKFSMIHFTQLKNFIAHITQLKYSNTHLT